MNIKDIRNINRIAETQAAKQSQDEHKKTRHDSKLIDVAHEAISEQAALDRATLETLVRLGWPHVQRERFKGKVRKKVWDVVSADYENVDPDMVEDITERLIDAAEADPYYKKMFEKP